MRTSSLCKRSSRGAKNGDAQAVGKGPGQQIECLLIDKKAHVLARRRASHPAAPRTGSPSCHHEQQSMHSCQDGRSGPGWTPNPPPPALMPGQHKDCLCMQTIQIPHTLFRAGAATTPHGDGGPRWAVMACWRLVVGSREEGLEPVGVLCMHAFAAFNMYTCTPCTTLVHAPRHGGGRDRGHNRGQGAMNSAWTSASRLPCMHDTCRSRLLMYLMKLRWSR